MIPGEQFVIELSDKTTNHEQWLLVVRFGIHHLMENQPLLMEVIVREAQRECAKSQRPNRVPADDARVILDELGLRLVLT